MSKYLVKKDEAGKFAFENIRRMLKSYDIKVSRVCQALNITSAQFYRWSSNSRAPLEPNALIRLYSIAGATDADYVKLREVIDISDEELVKLRKDNPAVQKGSEVSFADLKEKHPNAKRKTWNLRGESAYGKLMRGSR